MNQQEPPGHPAVDDRVADDPVQGERVPEEAQSDGSGLLSKLGGWLRGRFRSEAGPAAVGETENQFHERVFPRELEYVVARRQAVGDERRPPEAGAAPSVENQLVGIALSGGGIRSATFSLGVLQALERRGVFKFIDYLSTVSGGGFLGTSLSTLLSQPSRDSKGDAPLGEFPFSFEEAEEEEPAVSHLRNNSNYLTPRGPLDYLRIFAVLVRGIILNFLVLLPFLLFSGLIVAFFYGQDLLDRLQQDHELASIRTMVERDWAGFDGEQPVESLISALESQSLINDHRGMEVANIRAWLLGEARPRYGVRRETQSPLIRERGEGEKRVSFFRQGVTLESVIERLWQSETLRDPDALREVDVIERRVRTSSRWVPSDQRPDNRKSLSLSSVFQALNDDDILLEETTVGRFIDVLERERLVVFLPEETEAQRTEAEAVLDKFERRCSEDGLRQGTRDSAGLAPLTSEASLDCRPGQRRERLRARLADLKQAEMLSRTVLGLSLDAPALDFWVPQGKRNLRKILQLLYDHGLYDPAWLDENIRDSWMSPPIAYWAAYELGVVERAVLASLETERAKRFASSVPVDLALLDRQATLLGMLYQGADDGGRKTLDSTFNGKPGVATPGFFGVTIPVWAPSLEYLGKKQDLHEVVHQLWEHGALAESWFAERFSHPPAYLGQLELLSERAEAETRGEDAKPAPLPGTRYLLRVGLLWILLYPLLLTFRRAIGLLDHGKRFAATALTMLLLMGCALLVYVVLFARGRFEWMVAGMEWPSRLAGFFDSPARIITAVFLTALMSIVALPFVAALVSDLHQIARRTKAAAWRDRYERSFSLVLILIALVAFIEAQPYLIYHYQYLQAGHVWWSLGIGVASLLASMAAGPALASVKRFGKSFILAIVALLGPLLPALVYIHLVLWVVSYPGVYNSVAFRLNEGGLAVVLLGLAFVAHLINLPIDPNSTSLHGFYRDRLSRAYLVRAKGDTVVPEDDLSLGRLCPDGSGAPFHLINTALNLQGTRDPRLRRRRGDFFHFSRYFIGSKQTGYCETRALEDVFPHIHTSSAMAISAAAAAPNMGTFTTGPLVVLMALLNIRLGFWIPNPLRVNRWLKATAAGRRGVLEGLGRLTVSLMGSFRARPGAYLLLKEMLSLMDGDSRMVNLSDGGHMENTGVFELLRRRCLFIIACDAEADPGLKFGGLAALIRYARIDLGIEIDIQPDDLRLDEENESRQHCTLGSVRYPATDTCPAEVGVLLYIKSSITGDEDELISEYRSHSPSFPHESTADQFFGERQFEAYRALGYHICSGLFDGLGKDRLETFDECGEWFQGLAVSLSPGLAGKVTLADIQTELGNIQRLLREEELSDYFYEIYPELGPPQSAATEHSPDEQARAFRNVFHLVNIQLQLMEAVFVSSELSQSANREHPGNRGWMNLFRRWAKAQSFRRAYLASITTFSAPFQQFCRAALGLELQFSWHVLTDEKHEELASLAEETGLKSLGRPLPEVGQTLILMVAAPGTEPIIVGDALISIEGREEAEVEAFEMRAGYQGAGMRARALMALRRWMQNEGRSMGFSEAAAVQTQADEFDFDHEAEE